MATASVSLDEDLVQVYHELVPAEARLGESLARRGVRIGASVLDHWSVLRDHLHLYARHPSPAGMLVLGGRPDEGSRATGIPFTGAPAARRNLGLDARGDVPSPAGTAFWRAVKHARGDTVNVPFEAFFATVHLAHAAPFDASLAHAEVLDASARHVLRLLRSLRPQVVVAVGAEPLGILAHALPSAGLRALAATDASAFAARWPPGTALHAHPFAEVQPPRPFRLRIVPVAALDGPHAPEATAALTSVLARAWT